jgi:hypothetical protein
VKGACWRGHLSRGQTLNVLCQDLQLLWKHVSYDELRKLAVRALRVELESQTWMEPQDEKRQ